MEALTPIRDVADHFALPLSTLHFWERRGLLRPHRRAGVRCATVLAADAPEWRDTVAARIAAVEEQRARLDSTRDYLNHLLTCRRGADLERCPYFREQADIPGRAQGRSAPEAVSAP